MNGLETQVRVVGGKLVASGQCRAQPEVGWDLIIALCRQLLPTGANGRLEQGLAVLARALAGLDLLARRSCTSGALRDAQRQGAVPRRSLRGAEACTRSEER